jgi:multidrug efflux pump subunit AcrB
MKITTLCLSNRTAVVVAGILLILLGALSGFGLPLQLTPDVERPRISISTSWRASAPQEVESQIIEPQENALRGLPGLRKMESSAGQGQGTITLELANDVDITRVLVEVINRLNQVPRYPPDANEPRVSTGGSSFEGAIAWFSITPGEGNERDIVSYQSFVEDTVLPRLERVAGIAQANAFGGRAEEIRITFDPFRAAALGVDLGRLLSELARNDDISAGTADVGKRRYQLRYTGRYHYSELEDRVLSWRDGRPVYLADIASVERRLVDPSFVLSQNGNRGIAVNAIPETGVNVLNVMDQLQAAIAEIADGPLQRENLQIEQLYDESVYITDSVRMVITNLLLGMLLAIGVLWWFLRKFRATLMVAVAIPLCLMGAFLFLAGAERTLNTISLAGLAFATGMVLDASIVVLENIVRLREKGLPSAQAAERGSGEVWGALLASTATTVAIFLPVAFLDDVAGQLFADLALTISAAVILSLIVAVSFVPTAADAGLRHARVRDPFKDLWDRMTDKLMALTGTARRRAVVIPVLIALPLALILILRPQADYLPEGQQNQARAFIQAPPGMAIDTAEDEIVTVVNDRMRPLLEQDADTGVRVYWFGVGTFGGFMGVRAQDPDELPALVQKLNREILAGIPDTRGFASREAIFGRFSGGRSVSLDLQGPDVEQLMEAARAVMGMIPQVIPGATARPQPELELAQPELQLRPDDRRIAEAGWDRGQLGSLVRALGSGAFVDDYYEGSQRLNVVLRADAWDNPEQLASLPLFTPQGNVATVGELAEVARTAGPSSVRRVDRQRTITVSITPPPDIPLETVIERLRNDIAPKVADLLPAGGSISYSGQAGDLEAALSSMAGSFLLAIVILYLLMSALFQSFRDGLLVLVTLPLATFGGVIALAIFNLFAFQPMDLLTMIGFIILLGLVVNNAILLVYQARAAERAGMNRTDAVADALRKRLRPIFMSTLTSLFGMLPLLLVPGAGTELYRGLAAVIVGGMTTSTLFTLVLLPAILQLGAAQTPSDKETAA